MALETAAYSPLWRVGFYGCTAIPRLCVGEGDTLDRRRTEIDKILTEGGLKIIDQGVAKYSEESPHGYTYETCLLQSGAMIHTYPERRFVTAVFETCDGSTEEIVRRVVDDLVSYYCAEKLVFLEAPRLEFPPDIGLPKLPVTRRGRRNRSKVAS